MKDSEDTLWKASGVNFDNRSRNGKQLNVIFSIIIYGKGTGVVKKKKEGRWEKKRRGIKEKKSKTTLSTNAHAWIHTFKKKHNSIIKFQIYEEKLEWYLFLLSYILPLTQSSFSPTSSSSFLSLPSVYSNSLSPPSCSKLAQKILSHSASLGDQ